MTEARAIAVLGAGPAGAAVALGLAALGCDVCVVAGRPARIRVQRESFSARVVAALRSLGVEAALAAVEPPGARAVCWAGAERELPGEAQVDRVAFDAGLLADLERRGVRVVRDEALHVEAHAGGARVALASGASIEPAFVVEARGRGAPATPARERGPETLSVVQRWQRAPGARDSTVPGVAIASLADGWAWLADDGQGHLTTQLTLAARAAPARAELAATSARALRSDAFCRSRLADAVPATEAFARAATPVLDGALASARTLRVGDAAVAVDPLSGNGVFQALSTALVAPAVIRTLLRRPEHSARALGFYAERARDLFLRFGRVSRDFYALGAAHHGGPFWEERASWPDRVPAHGTGDAVVAEPIALAQRPVVYDGWIEEREVVITAERPLGTWQVAGVELAPMLRAIAAQLASARRSGGAPTAAEQRALASLSAEAREPVHAWLRAHRRAVDAWMGRERAGPLRSSED